MTATTTTNPAVALAFKVAQAKPAVALAMAEQGSEKYPDFRFPANAERGVPAMSFAQVAEALRRKLGVETPASGAESAQAAPKKTVPAAKRAPRAKKTVPAVKPVEPVAEVSKPETATLRLVHDGASQTSIFGIEKGSAAQLAIGSKKRGGLGWAFYFAKECFYLPKTQGYAADMTRIGEAVKALESIKVDGVQLYRVEQEITATDADGKALPSRMDADQAQAWQRAYDTAKNRLWADLGLSKGECVKCGATGLDQRTGRITVSTVPQIECVNCEAYTPTAPEFVAEPVLDLSTVLALPQAEESEECPACGKPVGKVDGKLALHVGRSGNGACRGRKVADVEPEPCEIPVKRASKRAPKSSTADMGIVVEPASDLVVRFAMQAQLSGMATRNVATEVRQELSGKIQYGRDFKGVKIEVRRDKATKQLTLTVTEGGEGYDREALTAKIVEVVKSVRGVTNRVHKTA